MISNKGKTFEPRKKAPETNQRLKKDQKSYLLVIYF
jgi:hypothetical protein